MHAFSHLQMEDEPWVVSVARYFRYRLGAAPAAYHVQVKNFELPAKPLQLS